MRRRVRAARKTCPRDKRLERGLLAITDGAALFQGTTQPCVVTQTHVAIVK